MPSRNTQPPWPACADDRQEAWHRRNKRLERWVKVYSAGIGGIALLSLAVLALAAASLAQKSQTVNDLKGILAWNIILSVATVVAAPFMAKHAAGTRPVLLSCAQLLGIGLWGSAFAPILTVGLWSGHEAQFRRRFEIDGGPTIEVVNGATQTGPLLGCMIGGVVNTLLFVLQSLWFCLVRASR